MDCPNSTESGCRCIEHDQGLRHYAKDKAGFDLILDAMRPPRLSVVTLPPSDVVSLESRCDETMTCPCRKCSKERASRTAGHDRANPFRVAA